MVTPEGGATLPLFQTDRGAVLSDCGRYRFRLWRRWGPGPRVVWIMLNPSTADAKIDDPTIRRCMGFARDWGMGGIDVVNLYPWRAADPKDLVRAAERFDVLCPLDRNHHLRAAIIEANTAPVAAWGAHPLAARAVPGLLELFASRDVGGTLAPRLVCLGTTKGGAPRHPLYVPATAQLRTWSTNLP